MAKKTVKKRINRQDITLRNLHALKKTIAIQELELIEITKLLKFILEELKNKD